MIYLTFSNYVSKRENLPEIMRIPSNALARAGIGKRYLADTIFTFLDGKTIYYKNRFGHDYQYTEDERIMIVPKAQPYS